MTRNQFNRLASLRGWNHEQQVSKLFDYIVEADMEDEMADHFDFDPDDENDERRNEPRSPIKYVVAGYNHDTNSPEFRYVIVSANEYEIENESDCTAAREFADNNELAPSVVFCERDAEFVRLMPLFDWASADEISADDY